MQALESTQKKARTYPHEAPARPSVEAPPRRPAIQRDACACGGGCPRCATAPLQTKLAVSQPGDAHEREADQVADAVMRMTAQDDEVVHERAPAVSRYADGPNPNAGDGVAPFVGETLRSPGQPLDAPARSFMESRFGHDFSGVRVHTDSRAAESAQAVNALAYTSGNHIVFRNGQYDPPSARGQRLIAHELTHVLQQRSASTPDVQREAAPDLPTKVNAEQARADYLNRVVVGAAQPYPGLKLSWDIRSFFKIEADMELRGVEATQDKADAIQASINRFWNVRFGDFQLSANVKVTLPAAGAAKSPDRGEIELYRGTTRSTIVKFGSGTPQDRKITLNLNSIDITWTPAHEFGHYMGLDDQYTDVTDAAGHTTSVPKTGWETDIMAKTNGVVTGGEVFLLVTWWANWPPQFKVPPRPAGDPDAAPPQPPNTATA